MITVEQSWSEVGFPEVTPLRTLRFRDKLEAIVHLVSVHLSFGGAVTRIEPGKVRAFTCVFRKHDIGIYEGHPDEISGLCELAAAYDATRVHKAGMAESATPIHEAVSKSPLVDSSTVLRSLVTTNGKARLKIVIMVLSGVSSRDDIMAGVKMSLDDLVAAIQLYKEGAASFSEAALLAA